MNCTNEIFCRVISVDWERALLAYDLGNVGFVTVELTGASGDVLTWKSEEGGGNGRLKLNNLQADSHYLGSFSCDYGTLPLDFTTLAAPAGKMTASFALIADPHLSLKTENRKGRFMVESAMIFQDVIEQCNQLQPDFVLLPGDITNNAEIGEFELTAKIMAELKTKSIAVPGNHDIHCTPGEDPYQLWTKFFGATDGIFNMTCGTVSEQSQCGSRPPGGERASCGTVVALNTAQGHLTDSSAALLTKALDENHQKPLLVITHYQLFDNEKVYRGGAQKVINNATEHSTLLQQLTETSAIIYAGHQNIPAVKRFGKAIQMNLPQPTQYPCGFVYVRCYENGFYHTFKPITSEVLRQWSRRIGELSVEQYNEVQWESEYRHGESLDETDFIAKF
ncbi:MAG: metallophosphoesterase [Victivallaceae bacterium]|nr:metallophosphoesterase [Victivallaceae bacterium]